MSEASTAFNPPEEKELVFAALLSGCNKDPITLLMFGPDGDKLCRRILEKFGECDILSDETENVGSSDDGERECSLYPRIELDIEHISPGADYFMTFLAKSMTSGDLESYGMYNTLPVSDKKKEGFGECLCYPKISIISFPSQMTSGDSTVDVTWVRDVRHFF